MEPIALLGVRPRSGGKPGEVEVLLKWKNLPEFEATWEDFQAIQSQFLAFHLEDKVNVWGEVMLDPKSVSPMQGVREAWCIMLRCSGLT